MTHLPLGEKESQILELKSRDSLQKLSSIGREVVGMLNASEPGEIWIGIREQDSQGVEIEPVTNPDHEAGRLRDFFIDTIEPPPDPQTIQIDVVRPGEEPNAVLRIKVSPSEEKKPYALAQGNNRIYVIRISDRLRGMTRDEIRDAFALGSSDSNHDSLASTLHDRRTELLNSGFEGLWLGILPADHLKLEIQDASIEELLRDPAKTGNRPMGWNFTSKYMETMLKPDRIELGMRGDNHSLSIYESGEINLTAPLDRLHWKGPEKTIYPWSLLEYPTSVFRLAATLFQALNPKVAIATDIGLLGITGWTLRPGSPGTLEYDYDPAMPMGYDDDRDILFARPLIIEAKKLLDHPDECAFRLVRLVYQAFGLREVAIPREYDREAKRLLIPD